MKTKELDQKIRQYFAEDPGISASTRQVANCILTLYTARYCIRPGAADVKRVYNRLRKMESKGEMQHVGAIWSEKLT